MNLTVNGLKVREAEDPDYADFWLELIHMGAGILWEVPLSKDELEKLKPYIPKWVHEKKGISG